MRFLARAVHASMLLDRAYRRFDRLRSSTILRLAGDEFMAAYNDVAYARSPSYDPSSSAARSELFEWEEQAFSDWLPPPPARVLVCGAGGGREAAVLAGRGYTVTAFDPTEPLLRAFAATEAGRSCAGVYRGTYGSLPKVWTLSGEVVDLSGQPKFSAAILGWASLSHLRGDDACVESFGRLARLTAGPIVASFFGRDDQPGEGTKEVFSVAIGYYRQFKGDEIRALAARAGVRLLHLHTRSPWPYVVVSAA